MNSLTLPEGVETTMVEIDPRTGERVTYDMITGEEVARSGIAVPERFTYNLDIGYAIMELIRSGRSLKTIGSMNGYPNHAAILRWKATHPDFKEKIELARRDYADSLIDDMVDEAKTDVIGYTDQELRAFKEKAATYKWVAEKRDPETYGKNSKVEQTIKGASGLVVINTGIDRTPIEIEDAIVTEIDDE